MAKRDMFKTAEKVKLENMNLRYDLGSDEVCTLMHLATDAPFKDYDNVYKAIRTAFYYGYVLGGRAVAHGDKAL